MINEAEFRKQVFQSHGVIMQPNERGASRVPTDWSPPNGGSSAELRAKIRDFMWDKAESYKAQQATKISDYAVIEICCRIPGDTIKKAISGKYKLTRRFLAKFTVGLKLDILEANILFRMHSGELNLTNDFDFIVYHALQSKDDIEFFIEEVEKYLGINLDYDKA